MNDLPQQAHKVADATMSAGASISIGSAAWAWLGTNHEQITALCAVIGLCITIAGYLKSRKK